MLASNIGLFTLGVSALFSTNTTQAIAALFPAIAAWVFLRGTALGWIPRAFLERHGLFAISIVGILFSGTGIDQALGWDVLGIATDARGNVHPVSTLGNTNYAGALSAVFAILGLTSVYFESRWRRVPGVGAALLGALHVAASHSLGGLLGLAAGMIALTVLLARRYGWKPVALIPLALIVAGLVPAYGRTRDRVAAIARGEDRTAQVRLGLWRGTARLAAAHPVLGCGTGNFQMEFPPFRDPEERKLTQLDNKVGYTEAADPHNTYLTVLAESGPVALVCLLAILGLAVSAGFRRARDADPGAAQLAIAGGAGLIALAVSGMFNSLGGHLPFTVLAALLAGGAAPAAPDPAPVHNWRKLATFAAAALLVGAAITWFSADLDYRNGGRVSKPEKRLVYCQAAVETLPGHWEARFQVARCWRAIGEAEGSVRSELRKVLEYHPHHVASMIELSVGASVEEEERWLRRVEALAPEYPVVHTRLVGVAFRKRDYPEARRHLDRILEILPDEADAFYTYGRTYLFERRFAEAEPWLRKAVAKNREFKKRLGSDHPEVKSDARFKDLVEPATSSPP